MPDKILRKKYNYFNVNVRNSVLFREKCASREKKRLKNSVETSKLKAIEFFQELEKHAELWFELSHETSLLDFEKDRKNLMISCNFCLRFL